MCMLICAIEILNIIINIIKTTNCLSLCLTVKLMSHDRESLCVRKNSQEFFIKKVYQIITSAEFTLR